MSRPPRRAPGNANEGDYDEPEAEPESDDLNEGHEGAEPASGIDLARQALAGAQVGSTARRSTETRSARKRRMNRSANLSAGRSGYSGPGADLRDPQAAGTVLGGMLAEMGWQRPLTEARIFTDWAALVGDEIAAHSQPESLREGELRVSAQSTAWATQIRILSSRLVARLTAQLGPGVVKRVIVSGPAGPTWRHGYRTIPGARGPRDTYG
ncbi:MAG: DUF721 domain-containing protein [Jatrophihabitans sp.]